MTTFNTEFSKSLSQFTEIYPILNALESENELENEFTLNYESTDSSHYHNYRIHQEDSFHQPSTEDFLFSPFIGSNVNSFSEEDDKKELEQLYYIKESEGSISTSQLKKFEVIKKESSLIKKKRGRGKANSDMNDKAHDKYSPDNLLRKIQVHFLTFIISFLNEILLLLNYNQKFLKLNYEYKRNVNKKNIQKLKEQNIKNIVCNEISKKYRNVKLPNATICEQIKDNEVLNKILSENYLTLFKKIYYKSSKIINLKEYGLDKNIVLSKKVKMFEDLLKGKDNEVGDKNQYIYYLKQCAHDNYLSE